MSAITRVLILGLLSLLLASCRGGGDDPMANIVSVSPSGTVGVTTGTVEFSADVDAPGSFTLSWDFDDGTFPATSTDLTPNVTLLLPDTYTGSVDLLIDDIVVDTFPFTYIIAGIPAVTAVTPDGSAGLVRALVDFEATVDGDFDSLAWTFDDGATLLSQEAAIAHTRILDPGTYEGTVTPTVDGVSGSAFPFEYTVDAPAAPTWTVHDVTAVSAGVTDKTYLAMTVHMGKLAIAFNGPGGLLLARAKTAHPCCPADWEVHAIDILGQGRGTQTLVSRAGRLIVAYTGKNSGSETPFSRVAVANVEEPTDPGDWTFMDFDSFSPFNAHALLNTESGNLYLVFDGGPFGVNLAWTAQEHPDSVGDWTSSSLLDFESPGLTPPEDVAILATTDSLQVAVGVSQGFGDDVILFAQSSTLEPTAPTDWHFHLPDERVGSNRSVFLLPSDDDLPTLLFQWRTPENLNERRLVVRQATTEHPESGADWMTHEVALNLVFPAIGFSNGSLIGTGGQWAERAGFLHRDAVNSQLLIYRQIGTDVNDRLQWTQQIITGEGDPGIEPVAVTLDGSLVVAYIDQASQRLQVAWASGLF